MKVGLGTPAWPAPASRSQAQRFTPSAPLLG